MTHLILLLALMQQPGMVCDPPTPLCQAMMGIPSQDWQPLPTTIPDNATCINNRVDTELCEPIDVPAIEETEPIVPPLEFSDGSKLTARTRRTCTDKTRILMHDEQDPPIWYCHKPQTGGN